MNTRRRMGWMAMVVLGAALGTGLAGSPIDAGHASVARAEDTVSVKESGSRFDPPVAVEQIPAGASMCVMNGKVHYATKGHDQSKCPVCGMKLVKQGKAPQHDPSKGGHKH